MKKAAFASWNDRIAPVFDVCRRVRLVTVEAGRIAEETDEALNSMMPSQRALLLAEIGAGTLVCGAISRPMLDMVVAYGIRVIPFVAGDLGEVIQAWLSGTLGDASFAMPGCRGRGRQGGGRDRRERMGRSARSGPGGDCVCPKCGHREPHERGIPCIQKQCPKCQIPLSRF